MSTSSLYVLPSELLHRIIDYIDTETVFFSFRNVCKHFYTIVNTYNQYQLDFRLITKPKFCFIRHFIQPENVISLVLSDGHKTSGQIKLFLSLFNISLFTRLRSLTLIQVSESDSIVYLQHISTCSLVSLSIDYRNMPRPITTTDDFLSTNLEKLRNLRKFELSVSRLTIDNMQYPIQHMKLTECILNKSIFDILLHFPHLETLMVSSISTPNIDENLATTMQIKSKLKSLTVEGYSLCMNMIVSILLCTPSLIHFKLIAWPTMPELSWSGRWWAEFFQKNLNQLKLFEFFFNKRIDYKETKCDIESIIAPFRTSFWLEKQWYVACNYYKNTHKLELYSIPICKSNISYECTANKISSTNLTNDVPYIMDNVRSLSLDIIQSAAIIRDNNLLSNHTLFSRVNKLTLLITNEFSNDFIDYLLKLIDFSQLYTLSLTLDLNQQSFQNIIKIINNLLNEAYNVQSIKLRSSRPAYLIEYLQTICSMLSNQVKHLTVYIQDADEMQLILNQFENFSSITFHSNMYWYSKFDNIAEELRMKGRDFIYYNNRMYASFWFDHLVQFILIKTEA
ncbi:unnamed protein product [Rotaria sordida]|uniref:F-box domain-containing protein n=1 Tax=Rotaria sordida TaxID=392033 RepID=A0A813Q8D5_9BILA|nr:unnamed protein product [Rotaria sordida]